MGLNEGDIRRVVWTFIEAAAAVVTVAAFGWARGDVFDWKAVLVGAVAMGYAAVKNLLLPDGSTLK